MFIKAKNGNVVETDDVDHAKRAIADGHDVFVDDPRPKGAKPKTWDPDGDNADEGDASGDE